MRHPELPIGAFLSVPLVLCSLPSHARAGSVCTMALIAWLAVVSVIRGVNALIWAGNVDVKLQVWCDITTKITIGFTYAVPASALCILRHLESVASTRNVRTTKSDKRWRQKFEGIMCFGIPLIGMALHYVVQGHRLDIIEDFGCYPPVYFSFAAIMILWVPPFVMSLASFGYAAFALRHFLHRRIEFAAHLRNSQSSISPGRYLRLMAMAVVEMIWDTGVNAYLIYFNSFTGLRPWISWENVHSNFSRVAIFPRFIIPSSYVTQLIWQWWIVPISCVFFFVFFAFGEEAMSDYRKAMVWFCQVILRQKADKPSNYGRRVLPLYQPTVTVTLPAISDTSSEQESKGPDHLSFQMPEFQEHSIFISNPETMHIGISQHVKGVTPESHAHALSGLRKSPSFDSEHSGSINRSGISFSTIGWQATPPSILGPQSVHIPKLPPTVTITRPQSDLSSTGDPVASPRTSSWISSTSRTCPTSVYRWSTSTDPNISISPAYPPDENTTMQYQSTTTLNGAAEPDPTPVPIYLHGGVRLTIETDVT